MGLFWICVQSACRCLCIVYAFLKYIYMSTQTTVVQSIIMVSGELGFLIFINIFKAFGGLIYEQVH